MKEKWKQYLSPLQQSGTTTKLAVLLTILISNIFCFMLLSGPEEPKEKTEVVKARENHLIIRKSAHLLVKQTTTLPIPVVLKISNNQFIHAYLHSVIDYENSIVELEVASGDLPKLVATNEYELIQVLPYHSSLITKKKNKEAKYEIHF